MSFKPVPAILLASRTQLKLIPPRSIGCQTLGQIPKSQLFITLRPWGEEAEWTQVDLNGLEVDLEGMEK